MPVSAPADKSRARAAYDELAAGGLHLDLTRGKPSSAQLDLAEDMLALPGRGHHLDPAGDDVRNYGLPDGIRALRELFAAPLQVPAGNLLAVGNSSLELMHDAIVNALLRPPPGGSARWAAGTKFLCPVPGYDRHFAICERYGIEMIPVPMTDEGPDTAVVAELVAADAAVKGIWCVPKYSNPTGQSYSGRVVAALASTPAAAPDFRLFWDNAYAVHHLTDTPDEIADVLGLATAAGNPDRPLIFGSTSKITFAGGGVAFFGASAANLDWMRAFTSKRSIGPDKLNQLRHLMFLGSPDRLAEHMRGHRDIIAPKFDVVLRVLADELGPGSLGTWTTPAGGYFISLDVTDGCASRVIALAGAAGVKLTPPGATFPYGTDPRDRNIRIAPTFPPVEDVEAATRVLTACVRLAAAEMADGAG